MWLLSGVQRFEAGGNRKINSYRGGAREGAGLTESTRHRQPHFPLLRPWDCQNYTYTYIYTHIYNEYIHAHIYIYRGGKQRTLSRGACVNLAFNNWILILPPVAAAGCVRGLISLILWYFIVATDDCHRVLFVSVTRPSTSPIHKYYVVFDGVI